MTLRFISIPPVFKDMPMWGCAKGDFSFVISKHEDEGGTYKASVKSLDAVPFDNKRKDLGPFATFAEAEHACNDFYHKRNN